MKIKICGLKSAEDSIAVCAAGADMLGFNFYRESVRYIERKACREIVALVQRNFPDVTCVGVFVNLPPAEVEQALRYCGLDLAQLSGDESIADYAALNGRAFKALRPRSPKELAAAISSLPLRGAPPAFLIDAHQAGSYGGTGEIADWTLAESVASSYPIVLAGGLTAENVADAIRQVRPWGVDVASGVERERGIKDVHLISAFIHAARQASALAQGEKR
jgi:phosphoribosylanthranilate isomerase